MFVLPLARAQRTSVSPAFRSALDRLFDESFERRWGGDETSADTRTPAMDVSESDTAYTVVLDVPGATREQLKVSVEGRRVTLSSAVIGHGDSDSDSENVGRPQADAAAVEAKPASRVLYRERSVAEYARTVVLPAEIDQAASQAKFDNGVLTLTLSKKVPTGATQLSIG